MLGGRGIWGGGWGCRGRCVGEISGRDVVFWPKMVEKWSKSWGNGQKLVLAEKSI